MVQYNFNTIYQLGNDIRYQAHPLPETETILCAYMNCIVYLSDVISWTFFYHVILLYLSAFFASHVVIGMSILFENINLIFCFNWIIINFSHFSPPNKAFLLPHFTTGENRITTERGLPKVNALNELIPMLSLKDVQIAAAQDFWGTDALYVSWIFSKSPIFVHEIIRIFCFFFCWLVI